MRSVYDVLRGQSAAVLIRMLHVSSWTVVNTQLQELRAIDDADAMHRRLVELNVQEQVSSSSVIQH
jgi:hypothetical protein